jgi:hypothetical protein
LDPSSLANTGVTFLRNDEKNKTAHRQTDRQTDGNGIGTERHREWGKELQVQ